MEMDEDMKVSKMQDLPSKMFTESGYFMHKIGYLPPIDYKERRTRNRQAIRLGDLESYEGCREFYKEDENKEKVVEE
jgi:hypothetical protein